MSSFRARYDAYKCWVTVGVITTFCVWTPTTLGQVPYVRIAKTGDPAPGVPEAEFWGVATPGVDADGRVAVRAVLRGPGITGVNSDAIFHGRPGNLGVVIRAGDPLPQFGDGVFSRFYSQPFIAQTGEIGLTAKLDGPGITSAFDDVLFAGRPYSLQLVAREGETPPDVSDGSAYVNSFVASSMGRAGRVAYRAGLGEPGFIGPPEQSGLWSGRAESPRLVARTGAQAPGTEPGVHFSLSYLTPAFTVNRRGAVAFPAPIDGPGVDGTNNAGIWAGTHADLGLVMRAGDPAPMPEPGATFLGEPQYAIINGNDRVMFPAFVTGKGIDGANNYGLWAGNTAGQLELIARKGDGVPVLGPDYTITGIFPFVQTEDDRVAMVTAFSGPGVTPDNNQAILFGGPGDWELLFREGDQAPGLPEGVVLHFDTHTPTIAIVECGAAGMLLGLSGDGVTETSDEALFWRASEIEPWRLVAREGGLFDGSVIGDGGLVLRPYGGGAGGIPSINDRGELVFNVIFEGEFPDNVSGAYLVPEPASVLFFVGLAFFAGHRTFVRRRSGHR